MTDAATTAVDSLGRLLRTVPDLFGVRWFLRRAKPLPPVLPL